MSTIFDLFSFFFITVVIIAIVLAFTRNIPKWKAPGTNESYHRQFDAEVKYCPYCGAQNNKRANYCEKCGKEILF